MLVYPALQTLTARVLSDAGFFVSGAMPSEALVTFRYHLTIMTEYFAAFLQIVVAIGFAGAALGLSVLLGKKGRDSEIKQTPYECGMLPIGEGAPRFSVKFYVIAMLFVLFDIEVVFMYPWALQFRDLITDNSMALVSMASFATILTIAYVYALKKGAFDWKS